MALKETINQMKRLLQQINEDLPKAENGNKAASQRVRTGTVKLEKTAKRYRKESVVAEKRGTFKRPSAKKTTTKKAQPTKKAASKKTTTKKTSRPTAKKTTTKKTVTKSRPKTTQTKTSRTSARPRAFNIKRSTAKLPRRIRAR